MKLCEIVEFHGKVIFNPEYPNGTPRKILNSSLINSLGWKSKIKLDTGLKSTYKWFLENEAGKIN